MKQTLESLKEELDMTDNMTIWLNLGKSDCKEMCISGPCYPGAETRLWYFIDENGVEDPRVFANVEDVFARLQIYGMPLYDFLMRDDVEYCFK